jgi:hypothetical protein
MLFLSNCIALRNHPPNNNAIYSLYINLHNNDIILKELEVSSGNKKILQNKKKLDRDSDKKRAFRIETNKYIDSE